MTLTQELGRHVSIFTNTATLESGSKWGDKLESVIRSSTVLLAVVSPGYLNSAYCQRELEQFEAAAREQTGGVIVGFWSRIVPVMLMPVDRAGLPPALTSVIGYKFFTIEPETGSFRELEQDSHEYRTRLNDLAQDLARMLRGVQDSRETIYVAASTDDLVPYSDRLTRELQARGYSTITGDEDLDRAQVYVMLIGEMSAKSAIESLSAVLQERPQLRAFVWASRDLETSNGQLLADLSHRTNVDLFLGIGFEQFFKSLVEAMKSPAKSSAAPRIYLMCLNEDLESVQPLVNRLNQSLRVRLARRDARAEFRVRLFAGSDGVLIYWGRADRSQIEMMIGEARKSEKPILLYLGPPYTPEKGRALAPPEVATVHGEDSPDAAVKQVLRIFIRESGPDVAA